MCVCVCVCVSLVNKMSVVVFVQLSRQCSDVDC